MFSFEVLKKKIWANFKRIIELFTKKIVKKLLKIWSWDPGIQDPRSGIRKKPILDPGSRIQGSKSTQSRIPDPGSQIRIRNTVLSTVIDITFFQKHTLHEIILVLIYCYFVNICSSLCIFQRYRFRSLL
jgi:hypothetical protein